jgi:hypothetical protein
MKKDETLAQVNAAINSADKTAFDQNERRNLYLRAIALVARYWLEQQRE